MRMPLAAASMAVVWMRSCLSTSLRSTISLTSSLFAAASSSVRSWTRNSSSSCALRSASSASLRSVMSRFTLTKPVIWPSTLRSTMEDTSTESGFHLYGVELLLHANGLSLRSCASSRLHPPAAIRFEGVPHRYGQGLPLPSTHTLTRRSHSRHLT